MSEAVDGIVLVVDDDAEMRELLRLALTAAGLTPVLAADGEAALRLLDGIAPDIILLDAVMPPPDGFEVCRRIKRRVPLAAIPVVFMTGLGTTEHVVAGLQAGGVDYLTKPPVLEEMVARLRVHIATSRMTRSAQSALDTAGRMLLATDAAGRLRWSTPQATRLLAAIGIGSDAPELATALRALLERPATSPAVLTIAGRRLQVSTIGPAGADHFFRIKELLEGQDAMILRSAFGITPREADVLLWIAAGKSNKDIGDILNISVRTVDKHVEQVFVKLGVENRSAATAIALRALAVAG